MTRRPPTSRRHPRSRCRGGFTLIEILIVVFILGLLTTLLVVGVKHLNTNAKRQQTHATLAQLSSLYAEWQITAKQRFLTGPMPAPGNVSVDFANSNTSDRFGPAVWFTRDLMWHLQQTPTALAALGKLPPAALMAFPAGQGLPYAAGYSPTEYKLPPTKAFTPFEAGDYGRIYVKDQTTSTTWLYFDCIQASGLNGSPLPDQPPLPPSTPSPAYWFPGYPVTINSGALPSSDMPQVAVPLDAWGNPIVFVPGGQLGVAGIPESNGRVAVGSGGMVTSGDTGNPPGSLPLKTHTLSSLDGKAFFASAGPDGDFSLGDDNLYSFEK